MERNRIKSLILILCYIGIYKCSVSYVNADKLRSVNSMQFNYPHGLNLRDSFHKIRFTRKLKEIDSNVNSEKPDIEYRARRGVTGSRRNLRVDDAHQIANYFLNGGPRKGNAHFAKGQICEPNSDGQNVVGKSNPNNDDNVDIPIDDQDTNTNYNTIVGAPHIPLFPLLGIPHISTLNSLLGVPRDLFHSISNNLNTVLHHSPNILTDQSYSSSEGLLGAPLDHILHHHTNPFHKFPKTLHKTNTLPLESLLHARAEINKEIHRKLKKLSKGHRKYIKDLVGHRGPTLEIPNLEPNMFYPEPVGYIVRFVPHNRSKLPINPITGSPKEEHSDSIHENLSREENADSATNDSPAIAQNEDTDESEKSSEEN